MQPGTVRSAWWNIASIAPSLPFPSLPFPPRLARALPGARLHAYRALVIALWFFALSAIAIWTTYQRSWSTLWLTLPHGWRLALACVVVLAVGALLALQLRTVIRLPVARRIRARPKPEQIMFFMPHTQREAMWFLLLSITAGFCEELLFRGYLVWFFAPWLGTIG